ncbi:unnamed protein product [Gongylonema pulchrum]|uniref:LITAF domain-containing protein n=1 Tax=Gongylonema pulchrum TaxID=637853 RepID=A0A183DNW2_9BILA|nr:unnamed protein product [Gongylonema pulchrum]
MVNGAGESNTHPAPPPSYGQHYFYICFSALKLLIEIPEATVGSSTNPGGVTQTSGKFGPFPPMPQPSGNPSYQPQTTNPTLSPPSGMSSVPQPQAIPVIVGVPVFGSHPCNMTCPMCHKTIVTETQTRAGLLAFIICGVLLLFGCVSLFYCYYYCCDYFH